VAAPAVLSESDLLVATRPKVPVLAGSHADIAAAYRRNGSLLLASSADVVLRCFGQGVVLWNARYNHQLELRVSVTPPFEQQRQPSEREQSGRRCYVFFTEAFHVQ
jgi:hypothetical protein